MTTTLIADHVSRAQARILSQFQRPKFTGLVGTIADEAQAVEDGYASLANAFNLSTAVGAQLDVLASLIGVSRYGLTDDQLRVLLYGLIALHNGNGTSGTLLAVAKALFQTDQVFFADGQSGKHAAQISRGHVVLGIGTTKLPDAAITLARSLIAQAVGAGINLTYVASFESGNAFACAGAQAWVRGYASVATPQAGGKWAGLVT